MLICAREGHVTPLSWLRLVTPLGSPCRALASQPPPASAAVLLGVPLKEELHSWPMEREGGAATEAEAAYGSCRTWSAGRTC